jgi:hypothetical protein
MQTIRRLYLYAVSFISLFVVIWGVIHLLRAFLGENEGLTGPTGLAGALSLVLVGLPVFLLHGLLAQRSAAMDTRERSSGVRAFFLYGAITATLLPAILNILASLSRSLLFFIGAAPERAILGGNQTAVDNGIAVAVNLLAAGLFFLLLKADWQKPVHGQVYAETRHLFRLLWLLIALGFIIFGFRLFLRSVLSLLDSSLEPSQSSLTNGLSLLLVGIPSWFFISRLIERSQSDPLDRQSFLYLAVIYAIAFAGLGALLFSLTLILESLLRVVLGSGWSLVELLEEIGQPLVNALSLGLVWAYYDRRLREDRNTPDRPVGHNPLLRLYRSVFAFFGLTGAFLGVQMLLEIGLVSFLAGTVPVSEPANSSLAAALANLIVAVPLWLIFWRALQGEATDRGEAGFAARRSLIRKSYLYWILFLGVTGFMFSMGQLLYLFLQQALDGLPQNLPQNALLELKNLLLFILIFAYHWQVLRGDARLSESSLIKRRTLYPVLVLVPGEGDFAERLVTALEHFVPGLPVALHPVSVGAPDESLTAAKAVILPFELLARPPEALRLWLQSFPGERLVVPSPVENWHWVGDSRNSRRDPFQQAALAVRDLVERRENR